MENNEKIIFDEQVRAALNNFAEPYNAEHWQKMTEQLDALDAADASFDQSLRGRLADISAVPMAGAWAKMADKLDDLDAADSSFDASLRGRLTDVAVVPSVGDWSKMSAKLDDFNDAETEFDDILRKKLENIAGKHPNHWAMMNERLDREFTLKGKILRYKIIEAALMLFAFFTVLNVLDVNTEGGFEKSENRNSESNTTESKASELENKNVENAPRQAFKMGNEASKISAPSLNSTVPNATEGVKTFDNSPNWRLRKGMQGEQNKKQKEQNNLQNTKPNQPSSLTPTGQSIVDNSVKNIENTEGGYLKNWDNQNVASPTIGSANTNVEKASMANQTLADAIAPINTLQANPLSNNGLDVPINLIKTNADKKGKWRLSVFGTAALDWVTTSFVYKREQHFQKQGAPSAGINALVDYKRGKIELESGFMVNQKSYRIDNAEVTTGSVVLRSTKIEKPLDIRLSIVSIPLNLNVRLKETRRWDIYAHSGVAANAIIDAFDRRNIIKKENLNIAPITSQAPPDPTPVNEVTLASYSKGLMNGGETRENVFLTGHIGIGLEYKLTPKTSLFMQPTASFMLNKTRGVGSLEDRIQTYSIQGGAKWRL
jgi:hypothetical protein